MDSGRTGPERLRLIGARGSRSAVCRGSSKANIHRHDLLWRNGCDAECLSASEDDPVRLPLVSGVAHERGDLSELALCGRRTAQNSGIMQQNQSIEI